jgi:quercetin dioxygenase-like cupin family protein
MSLYSWSAIPLEELNPLAARRVVHTSRMTVARLFLKAGALVPEHHHENEQITMLVSGKLQFILNGEEILVSAGDVLEIPPHAPHSVVALEDSEAWDLFAPRREDWLAGDDAYLRGQPSR